MKRILMSLFLLSSVACTTAACGVGDNSPIEYDCGIAPDAPGCPPNPEFDGTWAGALDVKVNDEALEVRDASVTAARSSTAVVITGVCGDGTGRIVARRIEWLTAGFVQESATCTVQTKCGPMDVEITSGRLSLSDTAGVAEFRANGRGTYCYKPDARIAITGTVRKPSPVGDATEVR